MKAMFYIRDTAENRISFYQLALFLLVLPYDYFYSELVLGSFCLHTLIHARKEDFKNVLNKPAGILISLYCFNLLSVLYSADKAEGMNLAIQQLGLILFPLSFALSNFPFQKYRLRLMAIFACACTVTIAYLYYDAAKTIYVFQLPWNALLKANFLNHNFSLPIRIHATYLAMYVAFAWVILSWIFLKKPRSNKWLCAFAALLLLAGMVQLSSRAVLIAFLLIMNIMVPFLLVAKRKRWSAFFVIASVSAAVLLIIYNVDSFKTRYVSELKTDLTDKVNIVENTEPRLARWEAIMELIKHAPLTGYGSGSENKLLKEKYFEKGLYISYLNEFNTHNQYLAQLLKNGVPGLLLWLFILYYGYREAARRKDFLLFAFLLLITVVSLSENVLDLNKGIFFYSFFFSLLLKEDKELQLANPEPGNHREAVFVLIKENAS